MRIIGVQHISLPGGEFTTVELDGRVPLEHWNAVEIDGTTLVPVFQSSVPDNMLAFCGTIEPKRPYIRFVNMTCAPPSRLFEHLRGEELDAAIEKARKKSEAMTSWEDPVYERS